MVRRAPQGEDVADVQLERKHADLAVRHLFAVSAGMCSARFGEPEILGQVRRAWSVSHNVGATNALLDCVFRHAVDAARTVLSALAEGRAVGAHVVRETSRTDSRAGSLANTLGAMPVS